MNEMILEVDAKGQDIRIDKYLCMQIEGKSRAFLQGLIESGNVLVNNKIIKSNYKLKKYEEVKVILREPIKLDVEPQDIPLDILYEDSDVIVVNKEKGMVVHPACGNYCGTLVNALLFHCKDLSSINGVIRPGIVHRIDKDTTGVLVVAKNDEAHNFLSEQLKNHSMKREYYALAEGRFKETEGTVDKPLGRNKKDRLKMGIIEGGKRAVTHYKVIKVYKDVTLVSCRLETGRTHQIRVHLASISHPLVGDLVYGYKKQKYKIKGQLLHARLLGFIHPVSKIYMEFEAPLPKEFEETLKKLNSEIG